MGNRDGKGRVVMRDDEVDRIMYKCTALLRLRLWKSGDWLCWEGVGIAFVVFGREMCEVSSEMRGARCDDNVAYRVSE